MAICEASVPGGPNREACDQHQVRVGLELHGQAIQDSERMLVDPSIERGLIPFGPSAEDTADVRGERRGPRGVEMDVLAEPQAKGWMYARPAIDGSQDIPHRGQGASGGNAKRTPQLFAGLPLGPGRQRGKKRPNRSAGENQLTAASAGRPGPPGSQDIRSDNTW